MPTVMDYVIQFARDAEHVKFRPIYVDKAAETESASEYFNVEDVKGNRRPLTREERSGESPLSKELRVFRLSDLTKPGPGRRFDFE